MDFKQVNNRPGKRAASRDGNTLQTYFILIETAKFILLKPLVS
jgi:hypothetical protein